MTRVLVLPTKFPKGFNGQNMQEVSSFPVLPIEAVLKRKHGSDAHFAPYYVERKGKTVPDRIPRLNREALSFLNNLGHKILFGCVVLDVDDPVAHDHNKKSNDKMSARAEWRAEQSKRLSELPLELSKGMARYDTRGGYRLLWKLESALEPSAYIKFVSALNKKIASYGITADKLKDWQRLYRLPFVLRDGKREEYTHTIDNLGILKWEPSAEDELVLEAKKEVTKKEEKPEKKVDDFFDDIQNATPTKDPIPQDKKEFSEERNTNLARIAGKLRNRGLELDELYEQLLIENEKRCEPPLSESEVRSIAVSICKYEKGLSKEFLKQVDEPEKFKKDLRFRLGDDVEVAKVVAEDIEVGELEIVYDRSKMWQYSEALGVWTILEPHVINRIVHSYSGEMIFKGVKKNGEPNLQPLKISAAFCRGVHTVLNDQKVKYGFFDEAQEGLVFRNCFVQVTEDGIEQREFSPEHRQTAYLPFNYTPGVEPLMFIDMLKSCWEKDSDVDQKIQLLREWIGSALLNKGPKYQQALVLFGTGANGKSTVQQIITELFPKDSVTAISPQDMNNEYRRAQLSTSRLNCVAELPEADILQSGSIKAMIGGDLVSARYIREAPFEYRPSAAHLFSANSLPGVRDMSIGFWRRWIVLTFDRQFDTSEMDRSLASKIILNELPAIASWALEGAAKLAARGHFEPPASSKSAVGDWRFQADQVASFLDQRCKLGDPDAAISTDAAYVAYANWAVQNGHRRLTQTNFVKRLKALGVKKSKEKNHWKISICEPIALVV